LSHFSESEPRAERATGTLLGAMRLAEMRTHLLADNNAAIADARKRSAPACASRYVDANGVGAIDGLCGRGAGSCLPYMPQKRFIRKRIQSR
jgi:hypothetical protein